MKTAWSSTFDSPRYCEITGSPPSAYHISSVLGSYAPTKTYPDPWVSESTGSVGRGSPSMALTEPTLTFFPSLSSATNEIVRWSASCP